MADDDTGLAPWSLTQLAAALAARLAPACAGRAVCELGCGVQPAARPLLATPTTATTATTATATTAAATTTTESAPPRRLLLTDANRTALRRLEADLRPFAAPFVEVAALDWADDEALDALRDEFDVVLASEVLYYNVDVNELMRAGATLLEKSRGIWILCSFLRGTSLRSLQEAAERQDLKLRLLDIFRVNADLLQSSAQVEGYAVLAVLHASTLLAPEDLWEATGLGAYEVSLEAAIADEDEEDAQASGAVWSAPFADGDDSDDDKSGGGGPSEDVNAGIAGS